jgi:hypothetical protein
MPLLSQNYTCNGCGGMQKYDAKTQSLCCVFCKNEVKVTSTQEVNENDYLAKLSCLEAEPNPRPKEVKCGKCAASFTFEAHVFATNCPYCDTPTIIECSAPIVIDGLLPFEVTHKEAKESFSKWVSSRWFAPTAFTKYFSDNKILIGKYLPHWTYDTNTITNYQGERGDAYYVSVRKTVMEDGKSVEKEVQERRIRWSYASGIVHINFDDVIVPASPAVSSSILNDLDPWESKSAKPFDTQYIAGFEAEEYTTKLEEGFDLAKDKMASSIQNKIRNDIGGDEQRISSQSTQYNAITYKNVLLPIWTAFFTWHNKEYQYAINAQTGELIGERPYSKTKIFFAVLSLISVVSAVMYLYG